MFEDVLDRLEASLDEVLASEQRLDVARVWRLAERMESVRVRAARQYERSERWRLDGAATPAAGLRDRCRTTYGAARQVLALARALEALPATSEALAAGEISRRHAQVIADAFTAERSEALREHEARLVGLAREVDAAQLAAAVRMLTDALDGDGGAARDARVFAQRRLHVSPTFDGAVAIDGQGEPVGGEVILTALQAEMADGHRAHDDRSTPQRRYDALVNICRRDLAERAGSTSGRRARARVSVVVDLRTLQGHACGAVADLARAEAAHAGRLSRATIERLSCDCDVSRVITDGPSAVLDVGRATRTVPPALWRALVVRDRHCRAAGCDRPPGMCEAHHVVHWARGGGTDLANLELLCWEHHRRRHGPSG